MAKYLYYVRDYRSEKNPEYPQTVVVTITNDEFCSGMDVDGHELTPHEVEEIKEWAWNGREYWVKENTPTPKPTLWVKKY